MQGDGWKVVASFEGVLPNRIKQLPLDQMFELSSIKKVSRKQHESHNFVQVC
jgi:dynamin GTPase